MEVVVDVDWLLEAVLDEAALAVVALVEALVVELLAAVYALDSRGCNTGVADALDGRLVSCMMRLPGEGLTWFSKSVVRSHSVYRRIAV